MRKKIQVYMVVGMGFVLLSCNQQPKLEEKEGAQPEVAAPEPYTGEPMMGFPPSIESQVTIGNYRVHPYSKWSFQNISAIGNTVMIPRSGNIFELEENYDESIGQLQLTDANNKETTVERAFEENYTDGILVVKNDKILYEKYYNGFDKDQHHIWYSATKSLTSTAFGILVDQGKLNLEDSPVKYIPELKGSGFERVTIQNVLDHSSSIDFKENYTDPQSEFLTIYAPAMDMERIPGAADATPENTEIYGIYNFLDKFIRPNENETAGDVFDYSSPNSDLLGWMIARISGMPYEKFVQKHIWSKLGTEHDASILADRAYMAISTGGFNSTLRDAARFGSMILNRGNYNGSQIVSAEWVDEPLKLTDKDKQKMIDNGKYEENAWIAYKNMWWIIDENKGEYAAVGVHGQVIYINRQANLVVSYFSSQPDASAANYKPFMSKIKACQKIANELE